MKGIVFIFEKWLADDGVGGIVYRFRHENLCFAIEIYFAGGQLHIAVFYPTVGENMNSLLRG